MFDWAELGANVCITSSRLALRLRHQSQPRRAVIVGSGTMPQLTKMLRFTHVLDLA
jgi:hypothetical protein